MVDNIEELLDVLYTEIEEAKNVPLSSEKCMIDRERVLDMIDDVKAELPTEIKRSKEIVAGRNEYMASAEREVETMRKRAEDYANHLVDEDVLVRQAEEKADAMIATAEEQCNKLKHLANEYCEDTLRRMEEAVADAYDEVKNSRAKFRSLLDAMEAAPVKPSRRAMYDAEADEEEEED